MGDLKSNLAMLLQRVGDELKRDRKKAVLVGALLIGACILVVRLVLVDGSTPDEAGAATAPPVAAEKTVSTDDSTNEESYVTDYEAQRAKQRDEYIRKIGRNIERDIFARNPAFFPPEKKPPPVKVVPASAPAGGAQTKRDSKRQIVQAQAAALVLQSTIVSWDSIAVINDEILRVGNEINGFEVVEIAPRICKVRKDSVTVILEMSEMSQK